MLDRDEIDNAVAVIALQWLALHRDEVRGAGAQRVRGFPAPATVPPGASAGSSTVSSS